MSGMRKVCRRCGPRSTRCVRSVTVFAREIAKRFPCYADLIDPRPPRFNNTKRPSSRERRFCPSFSGESLALFGPCRRKALSLLLGSRRRQATLRRLSASSVKRLSHRRSLFPIFLLYDLRLAHELYTLLLKPVEAGWKRSKQLIVVTNGALGSCLCHCYRLKQQRWLRTKRHFAAYRGVPWLARTHAVTMLPSVAALRTLRQIPPGSN